MHARDPAELYKDKIEVSLDGRQIFYLFFGGAVIVGLVFVLGVVVGRRVEARGHADPVRTAAVVDPLAALDRLEGPEAVTFKSALTGAPAPTEVEHAIAKIEKKPEPKLEPKPERAKPADKEPRKRKKADGESADAGGARYTLQLSSFQDRQEAEAFLATLKAAGYQAYVTEADVGAKGTFYRVRCGSYRSAEAASDARSELERITKKNASIMRL